MTEGSSAGVPAERPEHISSPATAGGCFPTNTPDAGIDVRDLATGTLVNVYTRHSCYRLVIVDGVRRHVLVQGGSWFREETPARMDGSTPRGGLLRTGWISIGLHLVIAVGHDQRIVTSRICSIEMAGVRGPARPA
jgi:hypothetical protein